MNHSLSSNPTSIPQEKKTPRRRLEHLADLQEGVDKFDMVPRCLTRAYFEGSFPEAKYKLLRIMMSHGEYFRVKRKYLEGIFAKKSLGKYLPELISEGYLDKEELPLGSGGYENVYHVRPITDWLIYRQVVDGFLSDGRLGNDLNDTNLNDTNSSLSQTSVSLLETKTKEPLPQCGGEISLTSITPIEPVKNAIPPPLGKRNYSSAELAVVYAKSMEFLYSKRGKHYDWDTANLAAENFICEHSLKSAEIVRNWALDRRDLHGMLKVKDDMFEFLWARFIDDTMGGNLS